MLPKTNNKHGSLAGRAMSDAGNRPGVARAGDLHTIATSIGMVGLVLYVLVLAAPELWPQLFGQ
jgi:hypothetical protein